MVKESHLEQSARAPHAIPFPSTGHLDLLTGTETAETAQIGSE